MNLYIMRHAIAVDAGEGMADRQRPLSEKGRKKLEKIARNLARLDVRPGVIFTSPALRTRQTAEVVAKALGLDQAQVLQSDNLAIPGDAGKLVEEIRRRPAGEDVLLVGHEPFLGELIGVLLAGDEGLSITMKKAGVCKLAIGRLIHGRCATLEWLATPGMLATPDEKEQD